MNVNKVTRIISFCHLNTFYNARQKSDILTSIQVLECCEMRTCGESDGTAGAEGAAGLF